VTLTVLVQLAKADPLEEGLAAINRGDCATAYKLLRPLAEQGDASAQLWLGAYFAGGKGCVEPDFREAIKWYRKSAEQRNKQAAFTLAVMYLNGLGVSQDYVLAHMWFNIAASAGAEYNDPARLARDGLAEKMTPEQIAEAQRLAREWLDRVRKGGGTGAAGQR
jgi:TPR repeat protein